jgi:hypothetical protein
MAWALKLKVNPASLRFERLPNRWGYCSPAGEITLALDLVNQDECFQDYVIVHELLYLRMRAHGRRFRRCSLLMSLAGGTNSNARQKRAVSCELGKRMGKVGGTELNPSPPKAIPSKLLLSI